MMTTSPRRRPARLALLAAATLLAACGGAAPAPEPPAPAAAAPGELADPELTALLDTEVLTPDAERRIRLLDSPVDPLPPRLGRVAFDTAAPVYARGNALLLLGQLREVRQLPAFAFALRAEDPDLRAAAATGLEGYLEVVPDQAVRLLRQALRDEEPWVQARALQSLGPYDAGLLRGYIPLAPNDELRGIARSLLQIAEDRGAALSEEMAAGAAVPARLERATAGGHRLIFERERAWESWGAAVGRLLLVPPQGERMRVADGVEVVAGVVPAFFSPDERWLVYEAEREIRVRDVRAGTDRVVGAGIAPRPLPFSERFLYLVPAGRVEDAQGATSLEYDVLAAPFAGGEPERLGTLRARVSMQTFGNYAPVRWMRVRQAGDRFFLEGDGIQPFALPDPFAAL